MAFAKFLVVLLGFYSQVIDGEKCSCGVENTGSRIVGGVPVTDHKYPWMAFLKLFTGGEWSQCGGSIVTDRHIMTAAHCVKDVIEIRVGVGRNTEWKEDEPGLIKASVLKYHEDYDENTMHNDVAMLTLEQPLQFSNAIRPICLPPAGIKIADELTVAGWGKTEKGVASPELLETTVRQYPYDVCNQEWFSELTDTQFCAGDEAKDSCNGDSGGPLMQRFRGKVNVVGLVSYGMTECGSLQNAVYTKVSSFLDWIQENTKGGQYCN